jgi:ammonia channel protein AmtB
MRERQGGMYSIVSYFLAKNVAEVMLQAVYPVIFSVIVYWMVGYSPTPQQFFIFLGFMELCMFTANSVALVISVRNKRRNKSKEKVLIEQTGFG